MFTGLVEELGAIELAEVIPEGLRLRVRALRSLEGLTRGDSIAMNGVCQTVVQTAPRCFDVIAVAETLRRTNFGKLSAGSEVNLERPLRVGDRLGGHFVLGHVDGTGEILERRDETDDLSFRIGLPEEISAYVVEKGSIAVDGVSLTVGKLREEGATTSFWVHIIPETKASTLFGRYRLGDRTNLEVDILAKHVERLLSRSRSVGGSR